MWLDQHRRRLYFEFAFHFSSCMLCKTAHTYLHIVAPNVWITINSMHTISYPACLTYLVIWQIRNWGINGLIILRDRSFCSLAQTSDMFRVVIDNVEAFLSTITNSLKHETFSRSWIFLEVITHWLAFGKTFTISPLVNAFRCSYSIVLCKMIAIVRESVTSRAAWDKYKPNVNLTKTYRVVWLYPESFAAN
jgi:hypothetical protein